MFDRRCDDAAINFVRDVKQVLCEKDAYIRGKFLNSPELNGFYKDRYKGITTWSVTEPILKFIIITELCDKYKLLPEDRGYEGRQLLDLSLYIDEQDERNHAEIGIEMKWSALTKNSLMTSGSLECFVSDFIKIKKCMTDHKYLLQFVRHSPSIEIQPTKLEQQILDQYDNRSFRYFSTRVISVEQFPIWGANEAETETFSLLLWKVGKNI